VTEPVICCELRFVERNVRSIAGAVVVAAGDDGRLQLLVITDDALMLASRSTCDTTGVDITWCRPGATDGTSYHRAIVTDPAWIDEARSRVRLPVEPTVSATEVSLAWTIEWQSPAECYEAWVCDDPDCRNGQCPGPGCQAWPLAPCSCGAWWWKGESHDCPAERFYAVAHRHGAFAADFLQELADLRLRIAGEMVEWYIDDSNDPLKEAVVCAEMLVGPADTRISLCAVRVETLGASIGLDFGDAEFSANSPTSLDEAFGELARQIALARHTLAKVGSGLAGSRRPEADGLAGIRDRWGSDEWTRTADQAPPDRRRVLGWHMDEVVVCERAGDVYYNDGNDLHEGLTDRGGPAYWMSLPIPPR